MSRTCWRASVGVVGLMGGVAAAQPTFTTISSFVPEAVSADGRVVVGGASYGPSPKYWTRETGLVNLTAPVGSITCKATCVSGDGTVIAGTSVNSSYGQSSWRWTQQTGVVPLAVPGTSRVTVSCISRDGRTLGGIVIPTGGTFYQSFVWTPQEGVRMLAPGSNYSTWLHALSPDGLRGVGSGSSGVGTWGMVWNSTYLWCNSMGLVPPLTSGIAYAMSADGQTAVGGLATGTTQAAMVWSAQGGVEMVSTPMLGGYGIAALFAVTDDGRTAVGHLPTVSGGAYRGVVWRRGLGMQSASEYFAARGVNLNGAILNEITGMSADGRVVVGGDGTNGFVIDLGHCQTADFDHDGSTGTDADIEAFFACLAGSCCAACDGADFNRDGDSGTDADIEAFFRVLGGGAC